MTLQERNPELEDLLSADSQSRLEPNFAWKSAASALLGLPALRGAWPMSSVLYTAADRAADISGQGNHLTDNNTVAFAYDNLAPYCQMTAANTEFLDRADGGAANWADIIGTEGYVLTGQQGLTLGGWFYFDTVPDGSYMALMGKGNIESVANGAYGIYLINNIPRIYISTGAAGSTQSSSSTVSTGQWYHIVGRWFTATSLAIFVNGEKDESADALAALQDTAIDFVVGRNPGVASYYLDGRASMLFLCAAAASDSIVVALYQQQRAMFGV